MARHHDLLERSRRARRRQALRLSFLVLILLVSLAFGLLVFLNQERFVLRDIEVSGNRTIPAAAIARAAREELAGRLWFFLARDRFWFYSPVEVAEVVSERFRELASVVVTATVNNSVRVEVVERQATAIWCPVAWFTFDPDCYYLDQTGFAFASAPRFSWPPLLVVVSSSNINQPIVVGSQPLPKSDFIRLINLAQTFSHVADMDWLAHRSVSQIIVNPDGDVGFYFNGFKIITAREQNKAIIRSLLLSVSTTNDWQQALAAGQRLDYLDLRFTGKIFYRFKE